nr:hypothetical protein P5630_02590 [Bacillus subtilis]
MKKAKRELLEFADKAAAPIVVTLPAKGVVPDKHPHFSRQPRADRNKAGLRGNGGM